MNEAVVFVKCGIKLPVLINLMESLEKWDGTPSQLYMALLNNAKQLGISARQKAWPKAPHVLVRQLNELAPSLKLLGWEVVTGIKSGSTRRILINSVLSVPSAKNNGERDGRDASFQSSSRLLKFEEMKAPFWSNEFFDKHECAICGYKKLTSWKAETFKGQEVWICEDCKNEWEQKQREVE